MDAVDSMSFSADDENRTTTAGISPQTIKDADVRKKLSATWAEFPGLSLLFGGLLTQLPPLDLRRK
jgi:hypothetical protein